MTKTTVFTKGGSRDIVGGAPRESACFAQRARMFPDEDVSSAS